MEIKRRAVAYVSESVRLWMGGFLCVVLAVVALSSCRFISGQETIPDGDIVSGSSIVINEVMPVNHTVARTKTGEYYPWIELYNSTREMVYLDDYYLTDDMGEPRKCTLRGLQIQPHAYLLIYCSGLDEIDEQGVLHTNFTLSGQKETTLFLSDGVHLNMLTVPAAQKEASFGRGGDGVVGVWLPRPTPGRSNAEAQTKETVSGDILINEYMLSNTFTIYDCDGDCGDWLELYNTGNRKVNLRGYGLTDDNKQPFQYVFSEDTVLAPGEYLLVYCDEKNKIDRDGIVHTNFSLDSHDKAISLFRPDFTKASTVSVLQNVPDNISCGRIEGESSLKFFTSPTPGRENATAWTDLSVRPVPDINRGVFISEVYSSSEGDNSSQTCQTDYIEIHNATDGVVSLKGYTLSSRIGKAFFRFPDMTLAADGYVLVYCDGAKPIGNAANLHAAVRLSAGGGLFYLSDASGRVCDVFTAGKGRMGMSSGRVGNNLNQRVFFREPTPGAANTGRYYLTYAPVPQFSVNGGTVEAGTEISLSVPDGYTVVYTTDGSMPTHASKTYRKPIVLSDDTVIRAVSFGEGAAVSECATQTYLVEKSHDIPIVCLTGDFGESAEDTDGAQLSPVHFAYFNRKGVKQIEFDCGAAELDEYRGQAKKGWQLTLDSAYGPKKANNRFFYETLTAYASFKSLQLCPAGRDRMFGRFTDELAAAVIRGQMSLDFEDFSPCALYVNGTYGGLYYLKRPMDSDYVECHYGRGGKNSFDWTEPLSDSSRDYEAMVDYCRTHDLANAACYQYVDSLMDMDSFIHYRIVRSYFENNAVGHARCYRFKEGKWRWMLTDADRLHEADATAFSLDRIDSILYDSGTDARQDTDDMLFECLLRNDIFKDRYLLLYCYHLEHTFAPERTVPIFNDMTDAMDDEIRRCTDETEYETWRDVTKPYIRKLLRARPEMAYQALKSEFGLYEWQLATYRKKALQMTLE